MTILVLFAVLLIASITGLAVLLPSDGYGHRSTPRSHAEELPMGMPFRA